MRFDKRSIGHNTYYYYNDIIYCITVVFEHYQRYRNTKLLCKMFADERLRVHVSLHHARAEESWVKIDSCILHGRQ